MKQFFFTHYGKDRMLHLGQKVECIYYNEEIQLRENGGLILPFFSYFTPVKLGIIIGDAGTRKYYLAGSTNTGDADTHTEQYLYVEFKEYSIRKAIPISCIKDAGEAAANKLAFLERNKHKLGQPGYDMASYIHLKEQAERANNF